MKRISTLTLLLLFQVQISFGQSQHFEVIKSLELLDQIYENLEKYYVDDLETGSLSKVAIDAMLKELDPYTVYYHESNMEDYQLMTTGQYGGIGALIRKIDEYIYIAEPYENNPAAKAGLKAGDKIIRIDEKDMKGKESEEVSAALKGPKGTAVSIVVERQGKEVPFQFDRAEIKLPDVPYYGMLDASVAYIKLNSFTQTAASDVSSAYDQMKANGMKELILDLRGNGGGLLIEAVKIVNLFTEKNQLVVSTKGRVAEENRNYQTMSDPKDLQIPLVILIDETSASASEIVAGALQDLDRAVIIGATSFGKGLVQRTYDLNYGSKVKITIAKYYTPSGRCVQRLEYYDRDKSSRPEEIPDSLVKIFKTKNGRDVIDGRGIVPDLLVEKPEISRLSATLYNENLIFDFATSFYYEHKSIDSAAKFTLSDKEYESFKNYVLSSDLAYSTASEEMLKKMKETADKESFGGDIEAEYQALLNKVVPSKERDLEKFREEIQKLLENEIVSRYYFQRGRAQHSFNGDLDLEKALEILKNQGEYNTILKK